MSWRSRLEQFDDRETWLAARRENYGIGASTVAACLNHSKYEDSNPWSVWSKFHRPSPDPEDARKNKGNFHERAVLDHLGNVIDEEVEQIEYAFVRHPDHPWAYASPDGWMSANRGAEAKTWGFFYDREGITEVHTLNRELGEFLGADVVYQIYWTLECTKADCWYLAIFGAFHVLSVYVFYPDLAVQKRLLERVGEFREKHLVGGLEPDFDKSVACQRYLAEKYAKHRKELDAASDDEDALIRAYQVAKNIADGAEASKDFLGSVLRARIGDAKGLEGPSGKASWSRSRPGRGVLRVSGGPSGFPPHLLDDALRHEFNKGEPWANR